MLKIANHPSFKSYISLHLPLSYAFAPYNKRNFVPKIMKDPKFTREGMFKPRKRNYQYDLTQPHIQYPERYYDEAVDKKLERKAIKERRKERNGHEEIPSGTARPLGSIIRDLTAEKFLLEGSSRLILNINELETYYQNQIDQDIHDLIVRGIRALNKSIHLKKLREVGIITTLTRKYGLLDKEIWNNLKLNLMKYLKREENETIQLLNHDVNEDNFIHTLNNILYASRKNGINIEDLIASIEEHFLPKIENFKKSHNLVLFTTALAKIPKLKNAPIWGKIEKIITPQIKDLNVLDAINLIHAYSKAQITPSFVDQLVEKFVSDFGSLKSNKAEKISIVALCLANLKTKSEKFNMLAEREIEANLDSVQSVLDSQFLICGFARLGIKNKKIYEHCANNIIQNVENLSLKEIEPYLKTFLPKNLLPKQFFTSIAEKLGNMLEENPLLFEKENTAVIIKGLEKWTREGMLQNNEVLTKFKEHSQYSGFDALLKV